MGATLVRDRKGAFKLLLGDFLQWPHSLDCLPPAHPPRSPQALPSRATRQLRPRRVMYRAWSLGERVAINQSGQFRHAGVHESSSVEGFSRRLGHIRRVGAVRRVIRHTAVIELAVERINLRRDGYPRMDLDVKPVAGSERKRGQRCNLMTRD